MTAAVTTPPVAAWLLDVDDTILDTAAAMRAAAPAAVQELVPELDATQVGDVAALYCDDPDGVFLRFAQGELTLHGSRGLRLVRAFERAGVAAPKEASDLEAWGSAFETSFRPRFLAETRVFADVGPALDAALRSGIAVGLLTNASESLTRAKLRRTTLATFPFVCVVTRDTLGFGKPDARVFTHAAALAAPGADWASVVYVGDDQAVDVEPARRAGLSAVLIDRSGRSARTRPRDGLEAPIVGTLTELLPNRAR